MDGNSHKPDMNPVSARLALGELRVWLRQEGGNQKIPAVLDVLAAKTEAALDRGEMPPAVDPDTLRELYFDRHDGRAGSIPAGRWLPRREVINWWTQRCRQVEQACRGAGADCVPSLEVSEGGGRGNPTTYRLRFVAAQDVDEETIEETAVDATAIRYSIEPAKAALWLRPVIGRERFRMRSWRGYCLFLLALLPALTLGLLWIYGVSALNAPRPVTASDLVFVLVAALLSWAFHKGFRPIFRLAHERVTIASDPFLALSQMNAQFRLSRDTMSKLHGGWFTLARHWGDCPICSAVVELADGGRAFPRPDHRTLQ